MHLIRQRVAIATPMHTPLTGNHMLIILREHSSQYFLWPRCYRQTVVVITVIIIKIYSWFSTSLGSRRRSPGSKFEDQLCWSCFCSRRASVMEQTASNNPVIWHSAEFQEPIESLLILADHFFFFSIYLEHGRPWVGLYRPGVSAVQAFLCLSDRLMLLLYTVTLSCACCLN